MTSLIRTQIVTVIEDHGGEIHGTETLARVLECLNIKPWLRTCARAAETDGEIKIIQSNGGRGHQTVYKRNRNQPGLPRSTR